MKETFIRAWKEDFNFKITVVFGAFFIIDGALHDGWVHRWISVPYFTSVAYGIVKIGMAHWAHRKFVKRQEELECRFKVAIEKEDDEEAMRALNLLSVM